MSKIITIDTLFSANVANLNRDDLGQVKSAIIGGTNRLRVSSQCLKRHIRKTLSAVKSLNEASTERSRKIPHTLKQRLLDAGIPQKDAEEAIAKVFTKVDKKTGDLKVLIFLSQGEQDAIYNDALLPLAKGEKVEVAEFTKLLASAGKRYGLLVSLFGRMFADETSLNVEAAASFSHAITVHEAYGQKDFFTAVDDNEVQGSGHLGVQEFGSGIYHASMQLDVEALYASLGIGQEDAATVKAMATEFLKAVFTSFPRAKRNGMLSQTLPFYISARVTDGQAPVLGSAFTEACAPNREDAIKVIQKELKDVVEAWEGFAFTTLATVEYVQGSSGTPAEVIEKVVSHV